MATCKGCGKEIVWGVTEDGKRIPLDPKPPVYRLVDPEGQYTTRRVERDRTAMVSHFVTCPQANQFSRSRRKGANETDPIDWDMIMNHPDFITILRESTKKLQAKLKEQ